jgi:protoporphyrinogen oxidase
MRTAIIGAGISGVSISRMLKEQGHESCIFERAVKPGGLVRCRWVDGNLFHVTGGHVFNSKNSRVLEWFWSKFDKEEEFLLARRNAKILMGDKFLGYPIENFLYMLDAATIRKITKEILALSKLGSHDPLSYENFEVFLLRNFGPTLYELYFKPYNSKIWNTELQSVPMAWLEGKLPMPDYEVIITSNILREEEREMVHSSFYYPKVGGSQFIIDRLAEGLVINTDYTVTQLAKINGSWFVNSEGPFDHIVYTGDVRKLGELVDLGPNEEKVDFSEVRNLRANGTSNMLCYTDPSELSWLYLPGKEIKAHRIIYTGNFSSRNNSNETRPTCVVEFSGKVSEEEMKEQLKQLPGNLVPIDTNYEPNSYVIQETSTRKSIEKLKEALSEHDFFLLGRFAEWEYYNMDKAIEASMIIAEYLRNKR